ncbi:MAG: hypothetical protein Q9226_006412 [Calogaya cf. arnoldii]
MSSVNCVNNLQHPINVVLGHRLWVNDRPARKHLEPVLRLASFMLESPASQRFIYSLLEHESHHSLSREEHRVNCHFRRSTASNKLVQDTVKSALKKLSQIVEYEFKKTIDGAGPDVLGLTTVNKEDDRITINFCNIDIRKEGFERISKRGIAPADLSRERFVLATTLCHEVIHAIDDTVPEKCNPQLKKDGVWHHYESQTECEIGWAWEMEVLGAIRIGCDHMVNPDMLHALPSLEQNLEELGFDGEQHMIYVHPTQSVADYMARLQRQEFWENTPRTMTMLKFSTRPDRASAKPISSMSPAEPMQVLKARAKRDDELKALLKEVSRKRASPQECGKLQTRLDFLAKRKATAALIRKINEDHPRAESREEIIYPPYLDPPTAIPSHDDMLKDLVGFGNDDDSNYIGMSSSDEDEDEVMPLGENEDETILPEASEDESSVNDPWTETPENNDLVQQIGPFEDDDEASDQASIVSDAEYEDDAMDLDTNENEGMTHDPRSWMAKPAEIQQDMMEMNANRDVGIANIPLVLEPAPQQDHYRVERPAFQHLSGWIPNHHLAPQQDPRGWPPYHHRIERPPLQDLGGWTPNDHLAARPVPAPQDPSGWPPYHHRVGGPSLQDLGGWNPNNHLAERPVLEPAAQNPSGWSRPEGPALQDLRTPISYLPSFLSHGQGDCYQTRR